MKQLPGQIGMFYEEPPPDPEEIAYLGTVVPRPPIAGRAGTPLDHKHTVEVRGQGRRGSLIHGLYDESQRLYQSGGELSSFVFWKRNLISISKEAWVAIVGKADWIEMIDHEHNECWRILVRKAVKHAVVYDAGIGERVGIPMDLWDVIRGSGTYKKRGKTG